MSERVFTVEELEALAKKGEQIPDGLNFAQINFYICMLNLCHAYRVKSISKDKATRIKKALYDEYVRENRIFEIWQATDAMRKKLWKVSREAYTGNCENCKKMIRIFDGLD